MHNYQFAVTYKDRKHIHMVIRMQYCNIHIFKESNLQYTVDRETIDVPSFISYTSQSISALSWVVAMHTTMSHISCLISALWLHHITCKGSNTQYALLHSVTETSHKKNRYAIQNILGVKKAKPSRKHQLLLFSACD